MSNLKFPNKSSNNNNSNNNSSNSNDNGSSTSNKEVQQIASYLQDAMKISSTEAYNLWKKKVQKLGEEEAKKWYENFRAKHYAKTQIELKLNDIGSKIKSKISPITEGISEIGSKIAESTKEAVSDTYTEVFGSGALATIIKDSIGKTLNKMYETLSNISGWLFKKGGKFLKNTLINSLLFFRWLKKFLSKSLLFRAIGNIAKTAWGGITGTLNLGGDLLKWIGAKLVASTAWKTLMSGINHLGGLFKGLTLKNIITSIGTFLANLIPKGIAGPLAGVITALTPTPAGDPDEMRYIGALNRGEIDKDTTLEEWREIDKAKRDDYKNNILPKIQKQEEESYNQWLKEFPTIANELFKKRWLIDADKNDDGYRDYNAERYNTFKTLVENPNNQALLDNLELSKESREELKNKSILKNAAGVSST